MAFSYSFFCKYCGHYASFSAKEDAKLEKKNHKRRGCQLMKVPHKNSYVLARPQLVFEVRKGKEIVETNQLSLQSEDEERETNNTTNE